MASMAFQYIYMYAQGNGMLLSIYLGGYDERFEREREID